jgi:hypothetical protein
MATLEIAVSAVRNRGDVGRVHVLHAPINIPIVICGSSEGGQSCNPG